MTSTTACLPDPQGDHEGDAEHDDDGAAAVNGSDARKATQGKSRHQAARTGGRPLRPSAVGLTVRIWSTPIRPSSKASAPPTR